MTTSDTSRACNASLAVARRSGCPSSRWQDAIAQLLAASSAAPPLTYINVGANKGYNVAEFMQRYHSRGAGRLRSSEAWHTALLRSSKGQGRVRYGCGLCNPCKAPRPRERLHVQVEVHAIEMVDVNMRAVQRLFDIFQVPGTVHHLAVANYSGTANYRAATAIGLEHFELGNGRQRRVPCTTLDAFAMAHLRPAQPIGLLSIDAEGSDALILEGASRLLEARRIAVLEFEFIARGFWRSDKGRDQRTLAPVLGRLEAFGYRCFWQGEGGQLAAASGPFWCDAFQFRLRSNLVCSHRADVLGVFCRLAGLLPSGPSNTATSTTSMTTSACIRVA